MVLVLGLGPSLSAQVLKIVPRGSGGVLIAGSELVPGFTFNGQTASWTSPSHGDLDEDQGGLFYRPGLEFWETGIDSFRVHHGHLPPSGRSVFLIADLKVDEFATNPLADCQLDPSWTWVGDPGNFGVGSSPDGSDCPLLLTLGGSSGYLASAWTQTGPGGGNTSITLDPGRPVGLGGTTYISPEFPPSLAAGVTRDGRTVFELELQEGLELVARAYLGDGTEVSTAPLPLAFEFQKIELNWWFASAPGAADGGLILLRDGVLEASLSGIDNFDFLGQEWSWNIGLLDPTQGATGVLAMKEQGVWTSPQQPVFEPLFADSAAGGSLEAWSAVVNPQKILILVPFEGADPELFLTISAGTPVILQDDSPAAERYYKASFSLGVDELQALSGVSWTLFEGRQSGVTRRAPPFRLEVRRRLLGTGFEIRALVQEGFSEPATQWVELPSSPRVEVSLQWWASRQPGQSDGGLLLRIDRVTRAQLGGLANDGVRIDQTSLGAIGIPVGIGGQLIIDDFIAWR